MVVACVFPLAQLSASLQTQNKGKTYRIKFEWGDKNKVYLDHVFGLFDE
jgi:hypothetical protein